jgi:hypothetical protein
MHDAAIADLRRLSALSCSVCGEPIAQDGSGAYALRTGGQPWTWVHAGACYARYTERQPPPALGMPRELVLELFERARTAGRLIERGR